MTLDKEQLRVRVGKWFSDVENVDDSILRFTRQEKKLTYAVYYFDISQELPRTPETLATYQDRVIGSRYFEGPKSVQWNTYLYFVTSSDSLKLGELQQARELIERDRTYARKFVISDEDLESVLDPRILPTPDLIPHGSVLSIWTDRLVEAGIDQAILSDDPLPARLNVIEASCDQTTPKELAPRSNLPVKIEPFIGKLRLDTFRDLPAQRTFEFGTANLIFGANGSGKTSLLEAIELFYCGRNKRNPTSPLPYALTVVLADGQHEEVTNSRLLQAFRDRNLGWYGQSEVKTNNLCQSFSQFNFLNTDAAVSLTDSTSRLDEDLSKLLVGPDASRVWNNIQRVCEAVDQKLRELHRFEEQICEERAELKKRLEEVGSVERESDSIFGRLEQMLRQAGWSVAHSDKETLAASLVEALFELISLSQQATSLDGVESPVSIDGLANYCREAEVTIQEAEPDIARLELLRNDNSRLADMSKRNREALALARQAKDLIEAGIPDRSADITKQQRTVARYATRLAGPDALGLLSAVDLAMTVTAWHETVVSRRSDAQALLVTAKGEYKAFSELRDQSLNLAQELRDIAARILRIGPPSDECPLCHTKFGPGELANQISVSVDEHFEVLGQKLLTELRQREEALSLATAIENVAGWLGGFCERANLGPDTSVDSALAEIENAKQILSEAQDRIEVLNAEALLLETQGLSMAKLSEISDRLNVLGYCLDQCTGGAADRLLSSIDQAAATSSRTLETETKKADELKLMLVATLRCGESEIQHLRSALAKLKENLAATKSLQVKLSQFFLFVSLAGRKTACGACRRG